MPFENCVANDDATAYGQAMHEAAIFGRVAEPRLLDTPVDKFVACLLVIDLVAIVLCR